MLKNIFNFFYYFFKLKLKKGNEKKIILKAEFSDSGGTRTYFISLLKYLSSRKYDIVVIMNNKQKDNEINSLIESLGCKIIETNFLFRHIDFRYIPADDTKVNLLNYIFKELIFWIKIIHRENASSLVLSVGYAERYLYTFLLPIKIKYILHTTPIYSCDKYKTYMLKTMLKKDKQIITVSYDSKAAIEKFWLLATPSTFIKAIHNYFEPNSEAKYHLTHGTYTRVLTIGSVEKYKNPFFFIECAKEIIGNADGKQIKFTWVGDGSLLEECKNLCVAFPEIEFVGSSSHVEDFYNKSNIYFQPSLQESHGIAVLGAMFHSLPCVVSDNGGLKESVANGLSGYVCSVINQQEAISNIKCLIHDEDMCDTMGKYGKYLYETKFNKHTWEMQMDEEFCINFKVAFFY